MFFTVDRLQITNGNLISFEFIDLDKPKSYDKNYTEKKLEVISKNNFSDEFFLIQYSLEKNKMFIKKGQNRENILNGNFLDFTEWFKTMNLYGKEKDNKSTSKALASATENLGDPYVLSLYEEIYKENFPLLNIWEDDNGLEIVEKALKKISTFGFDFDMFDSKSNTVFEFLKRESKYVTNLTAHPVRYTWNKRKFISLWEASKRVNNGIPELFCISYSEDYKESIQVIKILDFDTDLSNKKMVTSDIGYELNGRDELLEWLKKFETSKIEADSFLENHKKEIRDKLFWAKIFEQGMDEGGRWRGRNKVGRSYK